MNEHWPRWIFASLRKHFRADGRDSIITHVEGEERPKNPLKDYAEFRVDGPRFRVLSGQVHIWIAVNILFHSVVDKKDTHRVHKTVGKILPGFTPDIGLFRYGDDPATDDGERFGCLELVPRLPEEIRVNHFGQVDPTVALMQGTIEAHYQTYLTA